MLKACAIFTVIVCFGPSPVPELQPLEPVLDPVAYAVYAAVIPLAWANVSREKVLLLQKETDGIERVSPSCFSSNKVADSEWDAAVKNFEQANVRVRVLQRLLPIDVPYRLISKADIQADDARLRLKYPGMWQRLPESMEFAAVSTVGFNPAKTKAIVYVRLRGQGDVYSRELREGHWVAAERNGCGWIA